MKIKTYPKRKNRQYFDLYAFPLKMNFLKKNKDSWKDFIITTNKKQENVSENIDKILYAK